ncbi:hypothetical protein BDZ89DRAFT_1056991 [Hymenopellis radicata]|nr:hypothetical protein BDZ89DRAFT_1056991 [Hymenopellis radicata]
MSEHHYPYYRGQPPANMTDPRSGQAYASNSAHTYSSSSYPSAQPPYDGGVSRGPDPSYTSDGRYSASSNAPYSHSHVAVPRGNPQMHNSAPPPTHVGRSSYDYHHARSPVSPHSPMGPDAHIYASRGTSPYQPSSPTYSQYPQAYSPSHGYSHSQDHVMIPPYSQNVPLSSSPPYSDYSLPRAFTCDTCPLSFHRQHDLKRHEKTHSGSKPYTCNGGCGKTFTRKDALKRHQVCVLALFLKQLADVNPSQLVKKCGTFDDSLT